VISQLARDVFDGRGILYLAAIGATTAILVMAANTAYADFPRLAALQAADGFLPRQLTYRGSRLVYSRGIVVLALVASLLIVVFQASVTGLIRSTRSGCSCRSPSPGGDGAALAQGGAARGRAGDQGTGLRTPCGPALASEAGRQQRGRGDHGGRDRHLRRHQVHDRAWVVLVVIPLLVAAFYAVHRHYRTLAAELSLESFGPPHASTATA